MRETFFAGEIEEGTEPSRRARIARQARQEGREVLGMTLEEARNMHPRNLLSPYISRDFFYSSK